MGFSYRLVPGVQFSRGVIARGEIGEVRHVRTWFSSTSELTLRRRSAGGMTTNLSGPAAIGELGRPRD